MLEHHRDLTDRFNYTALLRDRALRESVPVQGEGNRPPAAMASSFSSASSSPPPPPPPSHSAVSVSSRSSQALPRLRQILHDEDFTLFFISAYLPGRTVNIYTQGTWSLFQRS